VVGVNLHISPAMPSPVSELKEKEKRMIQQLIDQRMDVIESLKN